jgi:predicted Zn-dependent protease
MTLLAARMNVAFGLTLILCCAVIRSASAQATEESHTPATAPISALSLSPAKVSHLQAALDQRDYVTAETLLLDEIQQSPHSQRAGSLLAYLGSIYFLNHDYWNAAVAWRKSDAISPLAPNLQFSSAMAYIELSRPDWARHTLESLAKQDNKNPLYVYWLGRLDYDAQQYS